MCGLSLVPLSPAAAGQDTAPPDTAIDSGPADGATVTAGPLRFTFHGTDTDGAGTPQAGATCSFRLSPVDASFGTPVPCDDNPGTLQVSYPNLANGSYTFLVRAHDASGNVDSTPASRTITVLTQPDTDLESQWHLKGPGFELAGIDARVVWPDFAGFGVRIGVVDTGLQHAHPDLQPNYLASLSWDFNFNDPDPAPFSSGPHGTAVAGLAAARGGNGLGVSGVAPMATVAGLRLIAAPASDQAIAGAMVHEIDAIDVLNNSWGPADDGATLEGPGPLAAAALAQAVITGRGGLGRVFVWAAGNGRAGDAENDNCNFDGYANSRYVIAVGAVNDLATQAHYSESCSALLVAAPSGDTDVARRDLTTTDLVGTSGYTTLDYTNTFSGTSGAVPVVSGTVALMLEQNPWLTWRDVKYILRETSSRSAISDFNAGWTSGPLPHSEKYGFGLINAAAAVAAAGTWPSVPPESSVPPLEQIAFGIIPDNTPSGLTRSIVVTGAPGLFRVEHIEVDVTVDHLRRGDLEITLTSPSGAVSRLATPRLADTQANLAAWRFGSARHWGEIAAGTWMLTVIDRRGGTTGTFDRWTLRLHGVNGGHLTGRVSGLGGVALAAVDVLVRDTVGTVVATATTDATGRYRAEGLAAGSYRVQVIAPADYLHQAYNAVHCASPCGGTVGQLVGVTEGTQSAGIDFALMRRVSVAQIAPASGSTLGGTVVQMTGEGFIAPVTVTFGGLPATSTVLVNAGTIHAVTPAHALGAVDVVVTTGDGQSTTVSGGFAYGPPALLRLTGIIFSHPTPVVQGTSVTVTAASIGGVEPRFQFWRYDVAQAVWQMVQDYSASAQFVWAAGSVVPGTYIFSVQGREAGSTAAFEASLQSHYYVVSAGAAARITAVRVTPGTRIQPGVAITLMATGAGGTGALEYEFRRAGVGSGTSTIVKPYGVPGASYTWTPQALDAGTFIFEARVRSQGATALFEGEYGNILVVVTAGSPAAMSGVSVTPSPSVAAGASMTIVAHGSGGTGPLEYQLWRYHEESSAWTLAQDYPGSATFVWNTTTADLGANIFQARVRSAGSLVPYEGVYQTGRVYVTATASPAYVVAMIPRPASPVVPGTAVTLRARAGGGVPPLEYQFWQIAADTNTWTMVRDFSIVDTHTWTAVAGAHLFQVRVRSAGASGFDAAWVTPSWFAVSTGTAALTGLTGPSAPVAAPAAAQWTAQTTGTGTLEFQFYRYHLQSGLWTMVQDYGPSQTLTWNTIASDAGNYILQVRARGAGSSAPFESVAHASLSFVSDGAPLLLTGLSASTGSSAAPGTPVTWTASPNAGELQFLRLSAATGEWTVVRDYLADAGFQWTPSPGEAGAYKFQVRVRKPGAASWDHATDSAWFAVSAAPVASLSNVVIPSTPSVVGSVLTWTAVATGGTAPLQYQFWRHHLESRTWSLERDFAPGDAFIWTTTAQDEGTYVMQVRVRSSGSSLPFESLFEAAPVQVRRPPPDTTILSTPDATTLETTATFVFSASEAGATFECSLDSAPFTSCTSPAGYTGLSFAAHTFAVRAVTGQGGPDLSPASYAWTVLAPDTTPPDTQITGAPPTSTASTTATFTFSSTESGSTFQCALDGAAFTACTSPREYTGLSVAAHLFAVRAIDLSGNIDLTPASYAWTIVPPDTTPPDTSITSQPPLTTTSTTATFAFSSSESGSTFACSLDGAAFTSCASPSEYTSLAVAPHTFAVKAIDGAGNQDQSPATYNWSIVLPDCGPPVTLTATADSWIDQASASSNNGSDSNLKVKTQTGGNFRALARFALPGLVAGCEVSAATLIVNSPSATTGRTLQARRLLANWVETSVTWTNQPATDTAVVNTASGTGDLQWVVDDAARAMYTSGQAYGFQIRDSVENGPGSEQQFRSREAGETPPRLALTFAPIDPSRAERDVLDPAAAAACGDPLWVTPSADTWLDQNSSTANFGRDAILKTRSQRGGNAFRTLLKFVLPAAPPGCAVQSSTLRLYAAAATPGRTLQAWRTGGSWSERGVRWVNQPNAIRMAASAASASGWVQWDFTAELQSPDPDGEVVGVVIRDADERGSGAEQQFHGREKGEMIPVLNVVYTPRRP